MAFMDTNRFPLIANPSIVRRSHSNNQSLLRTIRNLYIVLLFLTIAFLVLGYHRLWTPSSQGEGLVDGGYSYADEHQLNNYNNRPGRFKILFWTTWYKGLADKSGQIVRPECEDEFIITSNKSERRSADVIVFSYVDIFLQTKRRFPRHRDINVPWVLAVQESLFTVRNVVSNANGLLFGSDSGDNVLNGIFNWTWSYRSDSLIHPNFTEMFEKYEEPDRRWEYGSEFSKKFLRRKTKLAAWVVSNCQMDRSRRNALSDSLSKHGIQIGVHGDCGRFCEAGDKCFKKLGRSHKFYLAFENSLCEDYITEKIRNGLLHGMVPVVYAMGDVGMHAPPNSFINVLDFGNVSDLAERLKYLDENPEEYFKYFEWRQNYDVNGTASPRYQCYPWRKMKEYTMKLRSDESYKYRHVYEDFNDWFSKFRNEQLGKRCQVCLAPELINITDLSVNNYNMYKNADRCV